MSVSASVSDSCCIDINCGCDEWLTTFCDYETVTLSYCGVETEFAFARSKGMKISASNANVGVHPADRVFRLSMQEQTVEVGIGAVITDGDGTEWQAYSVEYLSRFCVQKIMARSVAACFQLLENIDVLELECTNCDDCENQTQYKRVGRVKGKVLAESGSARNRNDSVDLVCNWTGDLVRWPLASKPTANHRLKTKSGLFRISSFRDGGQFVPYHVGLEAEGVDCTVRGL